MSADGRPSKAITTLDGSAHDKSHRAGVVLPGGKALLMTVGTDDMTSWDDARIEAVNLVTGQRKVLVRGGMQAPYLATGHLLYARAGSLLAVPFDRERLEVVGAPVVVADGVYTDSVWGYANFAVSGNGSLAYVPGGANAREKSLVWVDASGKTESASDLHRNIAQVRISPDGQRAALTIDTASVEIWLVDLRRSILTRLVHGADNSTPVWTTDGAGITYASGRPQQPHETGFFTQAADGSGNPVPIRGENVAGYPNGSSSGDRHLLFTSRSSDDLLFWSAEDQKAHPFAATAAVERGARLSPDGRCVAYQSNETGRDEIYVRRFAGPSPRWPVSGRGGMFPIWSPSGGEIFFVEGTHMMTVAVTPSSKFAVAQPRLLFEVGGLLIDDSSYDVAPDGRFLMIKSEPRTASQLTFVQNWFAELSARFGLPRP